MGVPFQLKLISTGEAVQIFHFLKDCLGVTVQFEHCVLFVSSFKGAGMSDSKRVNGER